ncbi:MAG: hypothetical protein DMF95_17325 [Acidobacteria bacterium]|nr:MAG: hypothetical protein DMF96_13740 [Acidobacteriota bacterium]PYR47019.1 MAG: hypothetical protein DMF95_17325 [Acidobacteriota bacterium]
MTTASAREHPADTARPQDRRHRRRHNGTNSAGTTKTRKHEKENVVFFVPFFVFFVFSWLHLSVNPVGVKVSISGA